MRPPQPRGVGQRLRDGDDNQKMEALTKVLKWSAISALLGVAFSHSLPILCLALQLIVVVAAIVTLSRAARTSRYLWMTLSLIVACLFNPFFPIPFSRYTFDLATGFAGIMFFFLPEMLSPQHAHARARISGRL